MSEANSSRVGAAELRSKLSGPTPDPSPPLGFASLHRAGGRGAEAPCTPNAGVIIMSWQPTADPILGDKQSCDALDLVIVPRTRDLGDGFLVRRALPHGKRQMVGPFIFFDQMGPMQF